MLHLFFKWRHSRKSRAGAFRLPKQSQASPPESANLGSYLSQSSVKDRSFKPFDLARKRKKWMQLLASLLTATLIVWVAYESMVALALMAK
ncbi:MAG: hypothetical protein ACPG3X_06460 [Opitutales bacterium]